MQFRLKKGNGSVHNFTDAKGVKHFPGDIVDLPATYRGEHWLEEIKAESKALSASPSKVEPAPEAALASDKAEEAPKPEKKSPKKTK
jgi:hypothetical protein